MPKIARSRDLQIDEIDQWISNAVDQATVTLMVLGSGPDEAFHTMVLNDIERIFPPIGLYRWWKQGAFGTRQPWEDLPT